MGREGQPRSAFEGLEQHGDESGLYLQVRKSLWAWISVGFRQASACLAGTGCWAARVRSQAARSPWGGTSPCRKELDPSA